MACVLEGTREGVLKYFGELSVESQSQEEYEAFKDWLELLFEGEKVNSFSVLDSIEDECDAILIEKFKKGFVPDKEFTFDPFDVYVEEKTSNGVSVLFLLLRNNEIDGYGLYMITLGK